MKDYILIAAMGALLTVSCDNNDSPGAYIDQTPPIEINMTQAQSDVLAESSEFGLDLFREMCAETSDGNVIMSPLSAAMTLGMAANGDDGEAAEEIVTTLMPAAGQDGIGALNTISEKLMTTLPVTDKNTEMVLANSIWVKEGNQPNADFSSDVMKYFKAEVMSFSPSTAASRINGWVNEKTKGTIKAIYDPSEIFDNPYVFVNALYFRALWAVPFDGSRTVKEQFEGGGKVDMMYKGPYNYLIGECDEFEMLVDHFGNGAYQIVYVLPKKSMDDALKSLTLKRINQLKNEKRVQSGTVALPKFRVEGRRSLKEAIKACGIKKIFETGLNRVDNSDLMTVKGIDQTIYFETDEKEVKAAAVTDAPLDGFPAFDEEFVFKLNRPFIFMLQEKSTGLILFMGRISKL